MLTVSGQPVRKRVDWSLTNDGASNKPVYCCRHLPLSSKVWAGMCRHCPASLIYWCIHITVWLLSWCISMPATGDSNLLTHTSGHTGHHDLSWTKGFIASMRDMRIALPRTDRQTNTSIYWVEFRNLGKIGTIFSHPCLPAFFFVPSASFFLPSCTHPSPSS